MSKFASINSGWLDGAQYDPESKTLAVRLKNERVYTYADVPPELYEQFAATFEEKESSGAFLNKHIKPYQTTSA